jgi:hypothetical protein
MEAEVKRPIDTVRKWPAFYLTGIPSDVRGHLEAEAALRNDSLADTVRRHLCNRYHLDCLRRSWNHHPTRPGPNLYLRFQPELKRRIQAEAQERNTSMREVILSELVSVYGEIAA